MATPLDAWRQRQRQQRRAPRSWWGMQRQQYRRARRGTLVWQLALYALLFGAFATYYGAVRSSTPLAATGGGGAGAAAAAAAAATTTMSTARRLLQVATPSSSSSSPSSPSPSSSVGGNATAPAAAANAVLDWWGEPVRCRKPAQVPGRIVVDGAAPHDVTRQYIGEFDYSCDQCTLPLATYPEALTCWQRRYGGVLLHVLGVLYMFVARAIVVDDYFVASLDEICLRLRLSKDVAGATFMAAGGSVPELSASFIGVFIAPESNVGIGTIVGSAVFNVLFVIGMVALFSREVLKLTWWPLFRDVMFYSTSLVALLVFFVDSRIEWWESALLLALYVVYCVFMAFNERAEAFATGKTYAQVHLLHGQYRQPVTLRAGMLHVLLKDVDPIGKGPDSDTEGRFKRVATIVMHDIHMRRLAEEGMAADDLDDQSAPIQLWPPPRSWPRRALWLFLMPINACLWMIPDMNSDKLWGRRMFAVAFVLSMMWIAVFSYLMVWWATAAGDTVGIPPEIMGLTFLAAGTSIPDLLSSVIVARQGYGDMAVSSSLGSNLFDITVGLPLPWILGSLRRFIERELDTAVPVSSQGLFINILTLFVMLMAVIATIFACQWRMTRALGIVMFVFYVLFLVEALILEFVVYA